MSVCLSQAKLLDEQAQEAQQQLEKEALETIFKLQHDLESQRLAQAKAFEAAKREADLQTLYE